MVFLREEDTDWLANTKWSALKPCIQSNIIQTEQVVFTYLEICMARLCKYICVCHNNEKRQDALERAQGGVYGELGGGAKRGDIM